jgi:hypothetical protein
VDGSDCANSADVGALVYRFVQAFNAGDRSTLQRLWATPAKGFQWYSTDGPGRRLDPNASDRAGLEAYFADRHDHGERLRLTSFQYNGASGGYGHFQYTLMRQADDLIPTRYLGKGAAVCDPTHLTLGVWSMAMTSSSLSTASTSRSSRGPRPDRPSRPGGSKGAAGPAALSFAGGLLLLDEFGSCSQDTVAAFIPVEAKNASYTGARSGSDSHASAA